ncbi:MAG: MATE family efflux transporter [Synergistota bacterium]|nr:MATE family efflux transporter [Synergistota bacterium]
MDASAAQHERMTVTPVGKLIVSLAIPTIISMLVTAIYNIGDTFFVSKLGTSASGAVGIVFSLMAIIQAVGFTIGMGTGTWISRLLGAQKVDEANTVASSGFFAVILFGVLLAIFGLNSIDGLMRLLGATATPWPYARDYASSILAAAPALAASFLLNLVLDPIFIFVLELGIAGAAIATAISQCVSFTILISWFIKKQTITRISLARVSKNISVYATILKNGFPAFIRQALASVATIALNLAAATYGDAAVAAMAIVSRLFMFVFAVNLGIGQGYMPVAGYNYGAGKYDRVKSAFFFTLRATSVLMALWALPGFVFAPNLIRLFIKTDLEVVRIGTVALRAMCMVMPLVPIGVVTNMTFQSIGRYGTSTLLSLARQGIFFLPMILVLPKFIGLTGVQITQALSDVFTFLSCLPLVWCLLRDLDESEHGSVESAS